MLTLRCTRKLLDRLRLPAATQGDAAPTTRLGDWYANLLFTPGQQLVLLVNERTLLPVVIPAAPAANLLARFPLAVAEALRALDVPAPDVDAEIREMQEVLIGKTASRQVLGSMTDFAYLLDGYLDRGRPLAEVSLRLARTPCSPIGMKYPATIVQELFAATGA